MSTSRIDRFKKRKQKYPKAYVNARMLSSNHDINDSTYQNTSIVELMYTPVRYDTSVTDQEVNNLLKTISSEFDSQKYISLFDSSREVLIDQLLKPLHLSRQDIQSVDRNFEFNRNDWVKSGREVGGNNEAFGTVRDKHKANVTSEKGEIVDVYTGRSHPANEMDLDHVVSLKEMHDSGGFMLSDREKRQFGTDERNHKFTHQSNNRSKGERELSEWVDEAKVNGKDIDKRRTNPLTKKAELIKNEYVPQSALGKTVFVATRGAQDGLKTGKDQGLQQAVAALISEFITAIYAEAKDVFLNGWRSSTQFHEMSWIGVLKARVDRISSHLLSKWKNVVEAFAAGAISGFFTAIGTALMNLLQGTPQALVRLIREGGVSLFQAIKTFINPPNNLTTKQAAHEAIKILSSGLVVSGGIMLGEIIFKTFDAIPIIGPIVQTVVVGLITGIGALLVAYLLDKLDLFGVQEHEKLDFICGRLNKSIDENLQKSETIIQRLGLQT